MILVINPECINVKVGFEIHQQLATENKLFCSCKREETENYKTFFKRNLRPTQSELGVYDAAALFESNKMHTIKYHAAPGSCCLVEADEEPPHEVNREALETALIVSLTLHSKAVDEIHVMRKIVIDGSNTSGFQRTMLIANGGYLDINGKKIGVQTICLEEDAAKLISDNGTIREYGLDRLGVPLVEIALEPVSGKPQEIMQVARTLGRLLRASKRVARGLGSIRQDVNISVDDGNVVEVKGVQQLDQLIKVIEYEMLRQQGLILIAQKLKKNNINAEVGIGDRIEDVTNILSKSTSKVVKKSIANDDNKGVFKAIRVKGFSGMIGFEPYPDVRIGKQLSELVRFYGLGGVFHSDELPNYGIGSEQVDAIKKKLQLVNDTDAFVIVGGQHDRVEFAVDAIVQRLKMALNGVPAETRAATFDGKTIFSRPRSGSGRMYPETDIQPIPINSTLLDSLTDRIPRPWDEIIDTLAKKYHMNKKLAEQVFDSPYLSLFEEIANSTKIQPPFIASKLTEDLVNLQRQGLDTALLNENMILDAFDRLNAGIVAKESIVLIFEKIMKKESKNIDEAVAALGIMPVNEQELQRIIDKILEENMSIVKSKGIASLGTLMGRCMSVLRGKIDGEKINSVLKQKLEQLLASNTGLKTQEYQD
jgi:glutamyl-tRNA(Gln) amidotransferase subunit E